ncbi:MAG: winged helix-turn-helix domain-containing protein [Caldilineaceae bacterium]|nr:winged helix-turn-helix domain-containing protein [Caldilineaceae bacterium]
MVNRPGEDGKTDWTWRGHGATYRAAEMRVLTGWIAAGASGMVIGAAGSGKSNLLDFLCRNAHRLGARYPALEDGPALVYVRLGGLPDDTLTTFYRFILRAAHRSPTPFSTTWWGELTGLYQDMQADDPFPAQSALYNLLDACQAHDYRVVLFLDDFDMPPAPQILALGRALRSLHNVYRETLSFIVGARRRLDAVPDLDLPDDVYRLLATHICYVGPLVEADARRDVAYRLHTAPVAPTPSEVDQMLALSGGYPTLLKAVGRWWSLTPERGPAETWRTALGADPAMHIRLQAIWNGLTRDEQIALYALQRGDDTVADDAILRGLEMRGICRKAGDAWVLFGLLFADYVAEYGARTPDPIRIDKRTDLLFQGEKAIDGLSPKEQAVLHFLAERPHQRHTYTSVIVAAWDEDERYNGVSNDSLFQVIRTLRRKVEPDPSNPVYIVNYREKPEGGYLFYPEGRPT